MLTPIRPRIGSLGFLVFMAAWAGEALPLHAAEPFPPELSQALDEIGAAGDDGTAESKAMLRAIAAARDLPAAPAVPDNARDHAALGHTLAERARTLEDIGLAATEFARAARLAPWAAEYHYEHGRLLMKGERPLDAAGAFVLYLAAAPTAPDRAEVSRLIAALRSAGQRERSPAEPSLAGKAFRDCPDCPDMVVIPAGRFQMGSPTSEQGRFDSEGPQHAVAVRKFSLSKLNITEAQFSIFLAETGYQPVSCDPILDKKWKSPGRGLVYPPGAADLPEQPAVCINWQDIQTYIDWLNRRVLLFSPALKTGYRVPSEAEWEYAARATTTTSRWWGEEVGAGRANCHGCGSQWDNTLIAPGGSFGPNPFGLFDMLGNVWQWTADCWNESYAGAPTDGGAWLLGDCSKRVLRGGSWSNLPVFVRAAARSKAAASGADFDYSGYAGFRVARSLE